MTSGYTRPRHNAEKIERRLARYSEAVAMVDQGANGQLTEIVELLRRGWIGREIAEETGLAKSTVYQLLNDPTGKRNRARKADYAGICMDCGGETSGGRSGRDRIPKRCARCAHEHEHATAKWNREAIIEAMHRWERLYGKRPVAADWNSAMGADERYRDGDFPAWNTVAAVFGSWSEGCRAAGYELTGQAAHGGHPRKPCTPEELAATAALVKRIGLKAAASELEMSTAGVRLRLKKHNGKDQMSAPKTAVQVLDRELEKADRRIEQMREEIKSLEAQKEDLNTAKAALNGGASRK